MAGDYTRFTDDRRRRYSGVYMQQGRVQLDSDWNEEIEIAKRRVRMQALDTFGEASVAIKTTPDAFKVGAPAAGDLPLGVGRIYVDGLLAEIFPGETIDGKPISYLHQPFLPAPSTLPASGNALVYLDLWEREVTAIEAPDLLEKALGGPDTTTRTQTVWQVKVQPMDTPATCGANLAALFPPSAGRLTTQAIMPPAPDDPCVLAPGGGYRGIENRLYRVEIHTGGSLATARFKWSRENGSIVSAVTKIAGTPSVLSVSRVGRDAVLRFQQDDWVEVIDDVRELSGHSGVMAKVAFINEADQTLTLDRALPAGFDPTDPSRHTRVRRWDQRDGVDTDGLLAPAGGVIPLEDGVTVQFTLVPSGGSFLTGDFWSFAARTVDGSIETLTQAPPRGVAHVYCQLAVLTGLPGAIVGDCRPLHPDCCCTVEVGDGVVSHGQYTDIAEALAAAIGQSDGKSAVEVCIRPGSYQISSTIEIPRAKVTLSGCGEDTQIQVSGPDDASNFPALRVTGSQFALRNVSLFRSASIPAPADPAPLISLQGVNDARIEGVAFTNEAGASIHASDVTDLDIRDNTFDYGDGVWAQGGRIRVCRNLLQGGPRIEIAPPCRHVRIEDNEIQQAAGLAAVVLADGVSGVSKGRLRTDIGILRNRITDAAGSGIATRLDVHGSPLIAIPIVGLRVIENEIDGCVLDAKAAITGPDGVSGGVAIGNVALFEARHNRITQCGQNVGVPVCGIYLSRSRGVDIRHNTIRDNGVADPDAPIVGAQGGVFLRRVSPAPALGDGALGAPVLPAAVIRDNLVDAPAGKAVHIFGIGDIVVSDNTLAARRIAQTTPAGNLLDGFGAAMILDLGLPTYFLALLAALGFKAAGNLNKLTGQSDFMDSARGMVQFTGNQIALDLTRMDADLVAGSVGVFSLDDVDLTGNQTNVSVRQGQFVVMDVFVLAATVRGLHNGLTETALRTYYSMVSMGALMQTLVNNQGTHCLLGVGPVSRNMFYSNLVLLPNQSLCPNL